MSSANPQVTPGNIAEILLERDREERACERQTPPPR